MTQGLTWRGRHGFGVLLVLALSLLMVAAGVALPGPARAEVGVPVSYPGHVYGSGAITPSEDKPQSKLWYHDNTWWALMVGAGETSVYIHELMPDHTWRNTGTLVDSRVNSTGDALWSSRDSRLYTASRVKGTSNLQVNAFTYAAGAWQPVAGFPVSVNSGGGSESATIDQDSLGRLWVTYTRASRVWVAHSTTSPTVWTAGFQPAVPDTVIKSDDLSALIAFGTSIGLMWSDQESGAFRFAIHNDADADTVWRVEDALAGPGLADDHLNLKQLVGDPQGRIFAAIKTSKGDLATDSPSDTLVGVLTRTSAGAWSLAPAGTVADNHTRPMIQVDATNQELYFFATRSGDIVYKKTPLSAINFPAGPGAPFVDITGSLNNATGAKDPVTAASGMVILATAEGLKRYAHAEMELAGGTAPGPDGTPPTATTSPADGATGVAVNANVTATFSETVQGVSGSTFLLRNGATDVVATVSLDATGRVATLDPAENLTAGTPYTATLLGGTDSIRDMAGNALATTDWTFTTASQPVGDGTAPVVTARTPGINATGIGPAANLTATFSEAVQGVGSSTFTVTNTKTGAVITGPVTQNSTLKYTLNPSVNLAADTWHAVTLTGGSTAIRDASGTPLQTVTWEFLTGPPPSVTGRSPAANATGVSRTANVVVTFNEVVKNVTGTTLVLKDAVTGVTITGTLIPDPATVTADRTGAKRWTLDPSTTLTGARKYTVTVTGRAGGVTDLAGNLMANNATWSFTTV